MSKFKRDLKNDPIDTKTTRGQEIIDACNDPDNAADLGTIGPQLTAFTTANGELKGDASAMAQAVSAIAGIVTKQTGDEQTWNQDFEALLQIIESNTKNKKEKMVKTTVPTYEPGAGSAPAPGALAQVTGLSATHGDAPDEIDLQWNGMSGQKPKPRLFLVRMCADPYNQANMVQIGTPSASSFKAKNLTPGKKWFEVCAVYSGDQQGPWSDPATGTAI
jgi:hypothetical protein